MTKSIFLAATLLLITSIPKAHAQGDTPEKLQKLLYQGITKAYPAVVRMWGLDTVKNQQNSGQFSGVVVNPEGTILTVAHAIIPKHTYKVTFPDGRSAVAVALGRIASDELQNRPDMGMMKIITPGIWPFAKMGWSYSIKIAEPCISISYPETLNQSLPTVRYGRITALKNEWGFLESTCKMEPGDSGGPLFDYMGRVIGLHSRIAVSEDQNLEVPIDFYRQYWAALTVPENYDKFPDDSLDIMTDPESAKVISMPRLVNLNARFKKNLPKRLYAVVKLESSKNGKKESAVATVFSNGNKTFLLSKSSKVYEDPIVYNKDKETKAAVISRDQSNDLVLLQVDGSFKNEIKLTSLKDSSDLNLKDLGKFLVSPLPGDSLRASVVGSRYFALQRKFSSGYFGANATFIDKKIILTQINPGSPAELAKLALNDQITAINGVPITKPVQYGGELNQFSPGDLVKITGIRSGVEFNINVKLAVIPARSKHPADAFSGGKSIRRDGFKTVFSHDPILTPEECGGPVFDLQGRFYGINIARFSRTSTLIMPEFIIKRFIAAAIKEDQ